MNPYSWTCPFCSHDTTITNEDFSSSRHILEIENKHGGKILTSCFTVCPNKDCKEFELTLTLHNATYDIVWRKSKLIKKWNLIPPSKAKVFPDYIPKPIREDYEEACLIQDGSPKASATLSRRCLQGMIRDFWGVKESNLKK